MAPLNIYLIRHGLAEPARDGYDDHRRSLTPAGIATTQAIAQKLSNLGLRFDLLQFSPLVRASQTAAIFAQIFTAPTESCELLAPDGDFRAWLRWLLAWQEAGHTSLGLIGHEPDLSAWAEILVFGEAKGALVLKKTGIIGVTIPEVGLPIGNSLLFMLIPPKLLV